MKKIICVFPGILGLEGVKTMISNGAAVLELDDYKFNKDGSMNLEYPDNYIEAIKNASIIKDHDIVIVSSAPEVREELVKSDVKYMNVYPFNNLKMEYVKKLRSLDASKDSIKYMTVNFKNMCAEMAQDKNAIVKMRLASGIELHDIF